MFRVSTREKAEKEIERAGALLGHTLQLGKCERYWKIPELWACEVTSEFEAADEADRVFRCLLLANRLAYHWSVGGPHLRLDGTLERLDGVFSHSHAKAKLQSLEWAEFVVVTVAA